MSNTSIYVVMQPDVSVSLDDATLDVLSGASLNLTGSSNDVIVENGAGSISVSGDGNTVAGAGVSLSNVSVSGTNNVVAVGDQSTVSAGGSGNTLTVGTNSSVTDYGTGDTLTIGANGSVQTMGTTNTTINATQGEDQIHTRGGQATINANNDTIIVDNSSSDIVNGNNNQISVVRENGQLGLTGSNNSIAINSMALGSVITTSTGSLTEQGDGTLVLTGSADPGSVTLTAGVATVQIGNGNVATLSGVVSGTTLEYVDASGDINWTVLQDTGLTPSVPATFDFGVGSGGQTINAVNLALGSDTGVVDFASGISDNQLWFEQAGNNLTIDILGTNDSLTIDGWFNGSAAVQHFETADGLTVDSQVNQLVAAMAAYSAGNPGFNPVLATQMPTDSSLQNAIVAAWHH